jgi:hypothetical protein
MLDRPSQLRLWLHFLVNTPTIVATVDAALAAVIAVLIVQAAEAPRAAVVGGGVMAFLAVWGTLFPPAAAHPPPATPQDAEVPNPTGGTVSHEKFLAASWEPTEHRSWPSPPKQLVRDVRAPRAKGRCRPAIGERKWTVEAAERGRS